MASLVQARAVGGVGSILVLLSIVPSVGGFLGMIGWVLILVAVKALANEYSDSIFRNMLISVILFIVGSIIAIVLVLDALFRFIGIGAPMIMTQVSNPPTDVFALLGSNIIGLAAVWVIYLGASILLSRSYDEIAVRTNIGTFHTAGLLFVIGAATTIILVGFLIILVAVILMIVAFFSLPELAPHGPIQSRGQTRRLPVTD